MANTLTTNPVQYDTTGATSAITTEMEIVGIVVVASGDTWSCILHDAAGGDVIFRAGSALANERMCVFAPCKPIPVSGIYYTTGTNIALVLVYLG
jgi:hypothetical protein